MKPFFKLFISLSLLFSAASAIEFKDMYKVSLKKDEQTEIFVKYAAYKRVFKFRWTLYTNEGLIVFHSYDKRVKQNILYLNTKNQTFKVLLKSKGADFYEVPYLLVKFEEFDFEKHEAKFKIFLSDKKSQIKIKYPKEEE